MGGLTDRSSGRKSEGRELQGRERRVRKYEASFGEEERRKGCCLERRECGKNQYTLWSNWKRQSVLSDPHLPLVSVCACVFVRERVSEREKATIVFPVCLYLIHKCPYVFISNIHIDLD